MFGWGALLFVRQGLAADLGRPPVYKAPPMVAPFQLHGLLHRRYGRWCLGQIGWLMGRDRAARCL
jgi:hypothetical protein